MGWDYPSAVRGVLAALCALASTGTASASSPSAAPPGAGAPEVAPAPEIAHTQPPADESERLLVLHNAERARLGLPPLVWNSALARDAGAYAKVILSRGELQHASESERKGNGENLWMGTSGTWDADAMVGMFLEERRFFRAAAFPDVSLTGNWADVGHYSQIVWRDTKQVGCAVDSGRGMDVLVCRYYPAGNVFGKNPY